MEIFHDYSIEYLDHYDRIKKVTLVEETDDIVRVRWELSKEKDLFPAKQLMVLNKRGKMIGVPMGKLILESITYIGEFKED